MRKLIRTDPNCIYPLQGYNKLVFLKNVIKANNIVIGDYTYFDDSQNQPENFEQKNVLYNYNFPKVKLIIGKFCAIAAETRFLLGGCHKLNAISTYPFPVFPGWEKTYNAFDLSEKGDIVVGNDVWFGYNSLVMSGVTIGHGAIIAASAVVAGNPAKVVKSRFDDITIERLLRIAWWDWHIEKITKNLSTICNLDVDQLEDLSLDAQKI